MAELPDVSNVDPGNPEDYFGGVIPRDKYRVEVIDSQTVLSDDGVTPRYLELTFQVIDGPYKGRKLWDRLNLWHQNEQPRTIAQKQLNQLCHATNTVGARDSTRFHHKAAIALVAVRPPQRNEKTGKMYGETNEVKGYIPINSAEATTIQEGGESARSPTGVNKPIGSAPWRK